MLADELTCEMFRRQFLKLAAAAFHLAGLLSPPLQAQQQGQKTFASADEACHALFGAPKSDDEGAPADPRARTGKKSFRRAILLKMRPTARIS